MKRSLILVFAVILIHAIAASQSTPYVSPGVTVSWDFAGRFIVSPKVSVGVFGNGTFYNITVGRSSSSSDNIYPHYFVECQLGTLTAPSAFRKMQLFWGGGVGLTIPASSSNSSVSLRCSAFTGYFMFANLSLLFINGIQPDFGAQFVLPIPLKTDYGSIGG